ncbi:oligosaccharide flippase family protein [Priestia megaterium]|uniref:oligosaccharide flippase family protein n=1 Tax=Priestia megaterium TaxID=1404 RepID=UPI000BF3188B|nr:oligosaccharide flippase family protein [Priestia megaterium]MDP1382043.1 oligosaccharide flippase family protein [Priestia megaterium]MED4236379.1 oligosaccharide flippase family protein [Priestia megaterium]PFT58438.1 hypothetical protein COK68_02585 [Priestia megaterium]PGR95654.1 hypothetical protein COC61_16015 [Priestia megaterium]
MLKISTFNLLLRIITLGSKFLLMLGITKFLTPSHVGIYGMITTTIGLAIYIVGMDFYVFNTREMLSSEAQNSAVLIKDQFIVHFITYCITLPLLLVIFVINVLPWEYAVIFYLLLIMEHISQEFNRIFITLSKPVVANVTLFFRSGAWAYVTIVMLYMNPTNQTLWTVLLAWAIGVAISILLSLYYLKDLEWYSASKTKVNWKWIRRGLNVAFPLFIANIAVKLTEFLDRYIISFHYNKALVGVYTFYGSLANLLVIFANTGIIMILSPKVVKSYQEGNYKSYKIYMKKMTLGVISSTVAISLALIVGIFVVIDLINKPLYSGYLSAYWLLIVAYGFSVLSLLPHYSLYVRFRDKDIIKSSFIALFVAVLMNLTLVPKYGLVGGSLSTATGFLTLLICKLVYAYKISRA